MLVCIRNYVTTYALLAFSCVLPGTDFPRVICAWYVDLFRIDWFACLVLSVESMWIVLQEGKAELWWDSAEGHGAEQAPSWGSGLPVVAALVLPKLTAMWVSTPLHIQYMHSNVEYSDMATRILLTSDGIYSLGQAVVIPDHNSLQRLKL